MVCSTTSRNSHFSFSYNCLIVHDSSLLAPALVSPFRKLLTLYSLFIVPQLLKPFFSFFLFSSFSFPPTLFFLFFTFTEDNTFTFFLVLFCVNNISVFFSFFGIFSPNLNFLSSLVFFPNPVLSTSLSSSTDCLFTSHSANVLLPHVSFSSAALFFFNKNPLTRCLHKMGVNK
uniref:Uncharacterized protein n=1 Tax=Cacopsylla melanoneura TaxID=428564 RepID=A0A8D9BQ32_9HEMI